MNQRLISVDAASGSSTGQERKTIDAAVTHVCPCTALSTMPKACFSIVTYAFILVLAMQQVDSPHIPLRRSCLVLGLTVAFVAQANDRVSTSLYMLGLART